MPPQCGSCDNILAITGFYTHGSSIIFCGNEKGPNGGDIPRRLRWSSSWSSLSSSSSSSSSSLSPLTSLLSLSWSSLPTWWRRYPETTEVQKRRRPSPKAARCLYIIYYIFKIINDQNENYQNHNNHHLDQINRDTARQSWWLSLGWWSVWIWYVWW